MRCLPADVFCFDAYRVRPSVDPYKRDRLGRFARVDTRGARSFSDKDEERWYQPIRSSVARNPDNVPLGGNIPRIVHLGGSSVDSATVKGDIVKSLSLLPSDHLRYIREIQYGSSPMIASRSRSDNPRVMGMIRREISRPGVIALSGVDGTILLATDGWHVQPKKSKGTPGVAGFGMYASMIHEVAHLVHDHMGRGTRNKFDSLWKESGPSGMPTMYAATSPIEGFAESYLLYVTHPRYLRARNRNVYNFMRDNIFHGIEYKSGRHFMLSEPEVDDMLAAYDGYKIVKMSMDPWDESKVVRDRRGRFSRFKTAGSHVRPYEVDADDGLPDSITPEEYRKFERIYEARRRIERERLRKERIAAIKGALMAAGAIGSAMILRRWMRGKAPSGIPPSSSYGASVSPSATPAGMAKSVTKATKEGVASVKEATEAAKGMVGVMDVTGNIPSVSVKDIKKGLSPEKPPVAPPSGGYGDVLVMKPGMAPPKPQKLWTSSDLWGDMKIGDDFRYLTNAGKVAEGKVIDIKRGKGGVVEAIKISTKNNREVVVRRDSDFDKTGRIAVSSRSVKMPGLDDLLNDKSIPISDRVREASKDPEGRKLLEDAVAVMRKMGKMGYFSKMSSKEKKVTIAGILEKSLEGYKGGGGVQASDVYDVVKLVGLTPQMVHSPEWLRLKVRKAMVKKLRGGRRAGRRSLSLRI